MGEIGGSSMTTVMSTTVWWEPSCHDCHECHGCHATFMTDTSDLRRGLNQQQAVTHLQMQIAGLKTFSLTKYIF